MKDKTDYHEEFEATYKSTVAYWADDHFIRNARTDFYTHLRIQGMYEGFCLARNNAPTLSPNNKEVVINPVDFKDIARKFQEWFHSVNPGAHKSEVELQGSRLYINSSRGRNNWGDYLAGAGFWVHGCKFFPATPGLEVIHNYPERERASKETETKINNSLGLVPTRLNLSDDVVKDVAILAEDKGIIPQEYLRDCIAEILGKKKSELILRLKAEIETTKESKK